MKWTAYHNDVSKMLATVSPKRVKIPAGIEMSLIIDLPDDVFNRLQAERVSLHRVQEIAKAKAEKVVETLKAKVKDADEKALKFDAKTANIFSLDLNAFVKQHMDTAGVEMVKEAEKIFSDYKSHQKELHNFQVKSSGKIALNTISVAGAVAVSAASHGALAPAGAVVIARNGIVISQECTKLALDADHFAKIIDVELLALEKIMNTDLENAKKSEKTKQGLKEGALGVVSGVLGIETPTLKNLKAHIEVHHVDIAKLEKESHEYEKLIMAAWHKQEDWEKKFEAAKKNLPKDKALKVEKKADKAAEAFEKLLDTIHDVNAAINRANLRQKAYEDALDAMTKGLPDWAKYVQTATTMAVNIGLAIGGASSVAEGALAVLETVESDIATELIDRA